MSPDRRQILASVASFGTVSVVGCLGSFRPGEPSSGPEPTVSGTEPPEDGGPPRSDQSLPLVDAPGTLVENIVDGGVPQDGIPSIDDPEFLTAEDGDDSLSDGDPVFGVVRDGNAKAYPQHILVHHEIVNDELAGDPVAVTYCPLTGTAQGFERGNVEFGVSGQLLNSNLLMYDRDTESYWPQMVATGITDPLVGVTLQEFPVHWTTWERWQDAHPETLVLSEATGFARNYDRDPYGSYNPLAGHYADDDFVFPPYNNDSDDKLHPKDVVLGARTDAGAVAVEKDALREQHVVTAPVNDEQFVAVYDDVLDTGYVYRNPGEQPIEYSNGSVVIAGETFAPDSLPLDRVLRYDAMWFAWHGYYPDTTLVRHTTDGIETTGQ